jgi:hypothetical protein
MRALLPADLLFFRSPGVIPRLIRWATRAKGEGGTWANHVGGVVDVAPDGQPVVVEALWRVTRHTLAEAIDGHKGERFQVWRHRGLSDEERRAVAELAESFVGRPYGVLKIAAHLGDGLIAKVTGRQVSAFRRLLLIDEAPICSYVWSRAYELAIGVTVTPAGVPPRAASPDDMLDFVQSSSDWTRVA